MKFITLLKITSIDILIRISTPIYFIIFYTQLSVSYDEVT